MANTYVLINSSTVGSGGVSSVTFSSIPAIYTDLKVIASARTTTSSVSDEFYVQFNGLTTNLTYKSLIGITNTSTAVSNTSSSGYFDGDTATANTFGNAEIYIPNYTSSNYKSVSVDSVNENNSTTTRPTLNTTLWSSTAAITSITLISATSSSLIAMRIA